MDHQNWFKSTPFSLATVCKPFLSTVLIAFVDNLIFTKRLPSSHQRRLYCRFTCCSFFVLWLEKETLFPLFRFLPVKSQTLPVDYPIHIISISLNTCVFRSILQYTISLSLSTYMYQTTYAKSLKLFQLNPISWPIFMVLVLYCFSLSYRCTRIHT